MTKKLTDEEKKMKKETKAEEKVVLGKYQGDDGNGNDFLTKEDSDEHVAREKTNKTKIKTKAAKPRNYESTPKSTHDMKVEATLKARALKNEQIKMSMGNAAK